MADTIENQINVYLHCKRCIEEKPDDVSPMEWARVQCGITLTGEIQAWCNRHDINIAILDAYAIQHFANVRCQGGTHIH